MRLRTSDIGVYLIGSFALAEVVNDNPLQLDYRSNFELAFASNVLKRVPVEGHHASPSTLKITKGVFIRLKSAKRSKTTSPARTLNGTR
jgi:hypothetical protein